MKIVKLDSSVYNKIAAGEVVERPASVVKELVENSIDAGATEVEISVRGGGLESITVADNGSGIPEEDVLTAFLPHATSKLKTADELSKISTLGFRGEALASIASVSMIDITTKTADDSLATTLSLKGGEVESQSKTAASVGTEICVKNLFFNTPARLKFLKSEAGENSEIKSTVMKLMLANPSVRFTLKDNGNVVYRSYGKGLFECITALFSDDVCDNLIPLHEERGGISVSGYCSKSSYSKPNRTYQIFIINGRVSANQALTSAVNTIYSQYLMKRNYPVVVLDVKMQASNVDVNVHPTKAEVRFSDNNAVFSAVYHAIKNAVEKDIAERKISFTTVNNEIEDVSCTPHAEASDCYAESTNAPQNDFAASGKENTELKRAFSAFNPFAGEGDYFAEGNDIQRGIKENYQSRIAAQAEKMPEVQTVVSQADTPYKIIGQVFGTYLLLEYDEKFIIVDQHAAMERLKYEAFMQEYQRGEIAVQPMLFPLVVEVLPSEYKIVEKKIAHLNAIGLDIQPFGGNTFKLSAVPAIVADIDLDAFVKELLSDKQDSEEINPVREKLIYKACRSSIKGNTYLSNDEIKSLMNAYFKDGLPLQCPHGRPAFTVFSKKDMEKLFKRIV